MDSEGRYVKSVQLDESVVKLIKREVQNRGPALLEHILTGSVARTGRGEVLRGKNHSLISEAVGLVERVSPLNFFPRQADILSNRQPGTGEWLLQDAEFKLEHSGCRKDCVSLMRPLVTAGPEEHRDTLLRYLWKLGSAAKLMLTSRPHIGIDHIVRNVETLDVRASEDIRKYLEGQILKFLLAKLHIDSLMTKQNAAAVKDALLRLPFDLDGTYNDIVDRINRQSDDDRDLAWRTLSWVLNAKKPLRPSQLREALAVCPSATQLDPDRLTDLDIILSVCAGLVAVDEVSNQPISPSQSEITLTCMAYMRLTFEAFPHRLEQPLLLFIDNKFLHYAVEYCLVHAHGEPETHIQPSILYFLGNCSIWWRLWNWKHGGRESAPDKLHIARMFNLEVICARIIKQNEAGRLLQKAIVQGATDDVRILMEEDISAEDEDRTLETAVAHGYDEIFELLLACHPLDRKSRGQFGAALYQASCRGNALSVESLITHVQQGREELVQLLLEHGADVNAARYLLQVAVRQGHIGIVRLLIEHGANINTSMGPHDSMLCAASSLGHEAFFQLLLDHGANVNAEDGENGNTVEVAVEQGQEEIIQQLLKHGADANAELLYVAVWHGHEGIVRLLVKHGVNINTSVGPHGSALCAASSFGHKAVVQLLLDLGADVNAEGGPFGTALQTSLWNGKEDTARLLIQRGANVNTRGLWNGSALCLASRLGYETIVQQLLDLGADVNAGDGMYGSVVRGAFENGHHSIVKLSTRRAWG
ncbi:ankyrin repeat-containing domain protein [Mycena albidolilacea]|uniref:Ankyrin repeat-containing domain protein n=1 Tax=Mycena albidolilacea TaxID=1033008 RepID=A0AAD7EAG9_9AGAR|nr:ankyrin repeat-containing domain protein [Mycena albidolilacea]